MTQATLKKFGTALGAKISRAYHYTAPENCAPKYAVWQEIMGISMAGDNRHTESGFVVIVDYFTDAEYDTNIDVIETFLDGYGSWTVESVQYETDTGLIHYEWRLEYA